MSENCSVDCSHCGESCADRIKASMYVKLNEGSKVKKVIGVVSGKGGVGKSLITSMLAVLSRRKGYSTAVLDADITGPSIPKAFGIQEHAGGNDEMIIPVESSTGIKVMSINLLTEDETEPVIWRGPILGGVVKQFWTDVKWGDIDYMFIDMPPGTGDVPLTVFQSIPVDGIVIVGTPQELVGMIVEKAVRMADMMKVPVAALVENMSYVACPDCGKEIRIFGESSIEKLAGKHGIATTAKLPIDPALAAACDRGEIESFEGKWLDGLFDSIDR